MQINNVRSVVTDALFRMGKPTAGREFTWLSQVAITYLKAKAPLDGNVSLKTMYATVGNGARYMALPPDCMRISRVGLKAGHRIWTLTVDSNLVLPEELFQCESVNDSSEAQGALLSNWPPWYGGIYGSPLTPLYGVGGGGNVNYYRIVDGNIIFDAGIPDGQCIIEYLSNGSEINENTLIDVAYAEPFRLYLISEYFLYKGTREEKSMYKEIQLQYEAAQWAANLLVNAPRLYEMIDGVAKGSEFNLG